jgi:simple sugar transport system substrate-binding protein
MRRLSCLRRHGYRRLLLDLFALLLCCNVANGGPIYFDCEPCIDRKNFTIQAIVHGTKDDPFWQQIQAAMVQTSRDLGVDFKMELRESYNPREMAQEILDVIRYEIDDSPHGHTHDVKQIDGLIVTIPDPVVQGTVKAALHSNVHVFGLNVGYEVARETGLLGYVAQDEYRAGAFAAMEFVARRQEGLGPVKKALFVNHENELPGVAERFRGFNETLMVVAGIEADHLKVDADEMFGLIVDINNAFEACDYDFVLLAGKEFVPAIRGAFEHHVCEDFNKQLEGGTEMDFELVGPGNSSSSKNGNLIHTEANTSGLPSMLIATFDETAEIREAIVQNQVAFALSQQAYLQGAIPVLMASLYATTGKKLELPSDEIVYFAGPKLTDKSNVPSDSFLTCQTEGFPTCPNTLRLDGTEATCPCFDRKSLRIAGVVHGVSIDPFWDVIFSAAQQASLDLRAVLEMERFDPQETDELLHNKMASKIRSLCSSGVDGIFVSLPSDILKGAVRFCMSLGIPVLSINSGEKIAKELGVQHIGQLEYEAGRKAGQRLIEAGLKVGYCLRVEDNVALTDRCLGFAGAIEAAENVTFGGVYDVPRDNGMQFVQVVEDAVNEEGDWEGVGLLFTGPIRPALYVQGRHQRLILATFDVRDDLFEPLDSGRLLFTVDQQQYLQGSVPVYLLTYAAQTKQTLLNTALETGPELVYFSPPQALRTCEETEFAVCTKVPQENYHYIAKHWKIWSYCAIALQGFASLVATAWMQVYKEKNIVRASQPLFLGLVVFGCLISTFAIVPLGVETAYRYVQDPMTGQLTDIKNPDIRLVDAACMLGPWLYGLGFSIVFSALCAKITRVKMIYDAGSSMQRKKVEVSDVLSVMAKMFVVEVTILMCWTLISPSQWHREIIDEEDGYILESVGECTSESGRLFFVGQVAFHVACLFYALALCWQTKDIPTEFAESNWVALSILSVFQILVLAIPIGFLVEDEPDEWFFLVTLSIFLQNFTILCLIFGPKMLRVMSGDDELPVLMVASRSGRSSASPSGFQQNLSNYGESANTTTSSTRPTNCGFASNYDQVSREERDAFVDEGTADGSGGKQNRALESAPVDRMASIDSDSEDESAARNKGPHIEAVMNGYSRDIQSSSRDDAFISSSSAAPDKQALAGGDVDEDLAHLAAEISRAERSRQEVFASSVGELAPPKVHRALSPSGEPKGLSMSRSSSTSDLYIEDAPDREQQNVGGSEMKGSIGSLSNESPDKELGNVGTGSDDDSYDASGLPPGVEMIRKEPLQRHDSSDVDTSVETSSYPESPQKAERIQRHGSPDVDSSVESSSDPGSSKKQPRFQRCGSPDIDDSDISSSENCGASSAHEKNPQEGSVLSNGDHSPASAQIMAGKHIDLGTRARTGISKAEASKAEIFRKPSHSTPIRFRKGPEEYGDLAKIAAVLTKTSGSFLRRVACTLTNSASLAGSISTNNPASVATNSVISQQSPPPVPRKDWVESSELQEKSREFQVERQNRTQYQVLKRSLTDEEERPVEKPVVPNEPEPETADNDLYFL